ncbi:unnamed protein product [Fraxinus pennsylvanica]|uniref:Uncharacterized protein n=1 Tax=Fraxinus pennsylvanica TaxID=56036 RepID=A0AAD1ZKE6_9LAMI|nr:unnamed protein product [Fraxinus pennsylvanica]
MWMQPTSDGSNSKVQDTLQRASGTPFPPQSSSSNGVLNHSCGTVQGLHKVHGNVSISNVHWPDASGNSANYFGISQCVEQVAANTSNGRTSIINPQNTLSQLNLGGSNGHFTNVGGYGQGIFPYAENTGCIANSLDNLGIGGLGAAGVTNQAGPSHINLTAPQMMGHQDVSLQEQCLHMQIPHSNFVSSSRRLNESPIQFPNMNEMAPPTSSLMHVLALSPPLSPVHDPIDLSSASEYSSESENDIPNLQPHPPVMMISSDEEMDGYSTAESRVDND